jgi:hypothetical protein
LRSHWLFETGMSGLSRPTVCVFVADRAECNEIPFGIVARVATKLFVMDFQVRQRAAELTTPAIATQHLLSETLVSHRI